MKIFIFLYVMLFFCSCQESDQQRKERLLSEWNGREIAFPANILCVAGEDTLTYKIPYSDFLVVTYADSLGCANFKKQLSKWKRMIAKADSLTKSNVSFVFFLKPNDIDEMRYILHKEKFHHAVCFDPDGKLHSLNKFPEDPSFRSFLLNMNRQVIAVGNPTLDFEIEQMYAKIISESGVKKEPVKIVTEVSYESNVFDMGDFDWTSPHHITVSLKNTGNKPLIVEDVITSSSYIYVEYSHEAVAPGKKWDLYIRYKAEKPEFFNRDLTIYCNTEGSPLNFKVRGNAK